MATRKIDLTRAQMDHDREILRREWLVTNGLGGYASGTVSGLVTRRYHGLLVAALAAPHGRVVMLNHLAEKLHLADGRVVLLGGDEEHGPDASHRLAQFRLEDGLPVWVYEAEEIRVEKRLLLIHGQNTTHVTYRLLGPHADPVRLELRPSVHFRPHGSDVCESFGEHYELVIRESCYEINNTDFPQALRISMQGAQCGFTYDGGSVREVEYTAEAQRGYPARGTLWSPGFFHVELQGGKTAALIASTEEPQTVRALNPGAALKAESERRLRLVGAADPAAHSGPGAELVLAADQFIIQPIGRTEDSARARASGDEVRTVIAGYHWFTDWGRDTMISLEGLTLVTGRHTEAGWILRTFAHYIRDGLIPNFFPDGQSQGLYHTADATLWFFHALDRYFAATNDTATLELLLPKLRGIADAHLHGTRFGIGVDPADGLLRQGEKGYQLTWMDAKVGDWVVTPRRGKAVEINALWYNALRLLEEWLRSAGGADGADIYASHAQRAFVAFNRRFWSDEHKRLFDVVDGEHGDDPACRPNQIFSISLRHSVLEKEHWPAVLESVRTELLTPFGLRSLSPNHPDYKPKYFGDLRARDAAYHQGTVWAWLIGPFIDAWIKVHPDRRHEAREWLDPLCGHLEHACVGTINEIFDAEPPHEPRGCIAQAWSVAEALRCWVKTAEPSPLL